VYKHNYMSSTNHRLMHHFYKPYKTCKWTMYYT